MLGFEALYAFMYLVVASLLLGGASAILFLLIWRKTAKALVLAGLAVALTVMTYFSIWSFTWFSSEFQNSHLPACAVP